MSNFSRGVKLRKHKTNLDEIAANHQRNLVHDNNLRRLPKVVITHDERNDKYHVFTTIRNPSGEDSPTIHKAMNERDFLHFVVRSHKHIPTFHPFPQEGSIDTDHRGRVTVTVGHRDY
jgi:hypothetical protein